MGKFKCFDFGCEACGHVAEAVILDLNCEDPEAYVCECGELMSRLLAAPLVMNASFPDGTRRTEFQLEKEANRIRLESYDKPVNDRNKHNQEISKIKKSVIK